jgi:hypothetical protein
MRLSFIVCNFKVRLHMPFPHAFSALHCNFQIRLVQTKVSMSKLQCTAFNACGNGMCKRAFNNSKIRISKKSFFSPKSSKTKVFFDFFQSDAGSAMSSMVHENNVDVIVVEVNPSRSTSTRNNRVDRNVDNDDDVKDNVDKLVTDDGSTQHDSLESISILRDGRVAIENGTILIQHSE